jgi:hypothetical protein
MSCRRCIDKIGQIDPGKIDGLIASLQAGEKVVIPAVSGKKIGSGKIGFLVRVTIVDAVVGPIS